MGTFIALKIRCSQSHMSDILWDYLTATITILIKMYSKLKDSESLFYYIAFENRLFVNFVWVLNIA